MPLLNTVLKAFLRKGLFLGAALALILVLVEGILWKFAPVGEYPTYSYRFNNDVMSWGLKDLVDFEIDGQELRHRPGARNRSKTCRTLIIGGAIAYQPLQSVQDTWWAKVGEGLESRFPELSVPMMAKACAPGATLLNGTAVAMRNGVAWARTHLDSVEPDLLIVAFGVSEILDIEAGYRYDPQRVASIDGIPTTYRSKIVERSQIARRIRMQRTYGSEAFKTRKAELERPNHFRKNIAYQRTVFRQLKNDESPPNHQGENDPLQEYLDGLKAFQALAKSVGATLVVIGEPSLHDNFMSEVELGRLKRPRWDRFPSGESSGIGKQPDPAWVERELNRYYQAASAWAQENAIVFISLNDDILLPKHIDHFVDDTTLTDLGAEQVSSVVTPLLAPLLQKSR